MEWNQSEASFVAFEKCSHCNGDGIRTVRGNHKRPCNCVSARGLSRLLRAFSQPCRQREADEPGEPTDSLERPGLPHEIMAARDEEYIADFCLVSRRHLDDSLYKVFKYHFLLGADWKLCCRQMKIDRGTFFHAVYRIEQRLGRVFRELEPYALYPLEDYFGTQTPKEAKRRENVIAMPSAAPAPATAQEGRPERPRPARRAPPQASRVVRVPRVLPPGCNSFSERGSCSSHGPLFVGGRPQRVRIGVPKGPVRRRPGVFHRARIPGCPGGGMSEVLEFHVNEVLVRVFPDKAVARGDGGA